MSKINLWKATFSSPNAAIFGFSQIFFPFSRLLTLHHYVLCQKNCQKKTETLNLFPVFFPLVLSFCKQTADTTFHYIKTLFKKVALKFQVKIFTSNRAVTVSDVDRRRLSFLPMVFSVFSAKADASSSQSAVVLRIGESRRHFPFNHSECQRTTETLRESFPKAETSK